MQPKQRSQGARRALVTAVFAAASTSGRALLLASELDIVVGGWFPPPPALQNDVPPVVQLVPMPRLAPVTEPPPEVVPSPSPAALMALSALSRNLTSVQDDVEKAETKFFGKNFDVNAVQSFMKRDAEMKSSNQAAKTSIAALEMKRNGLRTQLSRGRQQLQVRQSRMRAEEEQLQNTEAKQQSTKQEIQREIANLRTVREEEGFLMKQIHEDLQTPVEQQLLKSEMMKHQIQTAIAKGEAFKALVEEQELGKTRMAIDVELKKHQNLKMQLLTLHKYGEACHTREDQIEKETHLQNVEGPKENLLVDAVEKHAIAAENAATQRLQAEKMILSAELKEVENQVKMAFTALTAKTKQFERLKVEITAQFKATRAEMEEDMEYIKKVNKAIHANIQKEKQDRKKLELVELTIIQIMKELDPAKLATLKADYKALQKAFIRTDAALQKSKMAESQALAEAGEAAAETKAFSAAAKTSQEEKEKATEEGSAELKKEVLKAAAHKAKAEKDAKAAMVALEVKCRDEWDDISAKKAKEVKACDALQSELSVAKAQQEVLMSTLKARAAAAVL